MERKGPFGLWMGMKPEEFPGELKEVAPHKYSTSAPPKVHSAFERYVLEMPPKTGLSWIKAIGRDVQTNVFGTTLSGAFADMLQRLTAVYGRGEVNDFLMPGSIWGDPQDWMVGLLKRDRHLFAK